VHHQKPKTVVDFCVGDGELLRAAAKKWPDIKCFGIDISHKAVSTVKLLHSEWCLSKCDFLNERSRNSCNVIKRRNDGFDLILLNPPFTCVGGSKHEVELDGKSYSVSSAMAFVIASMKYRSKEGSIYAILPNSVAYSQKDRRIWRDLVKNYKLIVLEESTKKHFLDCSPNIILISINGNSSTNVSTETKNLLIYNENHVVFRGKISMHTIDHDLNNGDLLIHSTNLQNNKVENLKYKVQGRFSKITGPAVLISRVGKPDIKKIATISNGANYFLSDCVIAIKTKTQDESTELQTELIANWIEFEKLYKGTGAKYITIENVEKFLSLKN
jgi:methylase of polypeptide subunit release factors